VHGQQSPRLPSLSLVGEFVLPGPDAPVFFASVGGVDVAPNGNILVADPLNKTLYRFGEGGEFLDSLGREGGGPGEFRHATAVAVGPAGEIAALDIGARRVTIWATDGTIMGTTMLPGQPSQIWWTQAGLYIRTHPFGYVERRVSFHRLTPGVDTTGPPTVSIRLGRDPRASLTQDLTCEYCAAAMAPNGDAILAAPNPKAYKVVEVSAAGRVVRAWERPDLPPERFTDEELAQTRAAMARAGVRFEPDQFEFAPRIMDIAMDVAGRLWVLRRSSGGTSRTLDVFAGDGRLTAELAVPSTTRGLTVRSGRVLLTGTNDDGEPIVRVYRIREVRGGEK